MYQFSETFWDARKSFSEILRNWISFYGPPGGLKPMDELEPMILL